MHLNVARAARVGVLLFVILAILVAPLIAQDNSVPNRFPGLKWRLIGPFRAGRVSALAGVPGDPHTFYFGTPGGGIWKTSDGGNVWQSIFDTVRVTSIGALAVAPSDPNVIFAGTGEQTRGKGVYRSNDAGATWTNIGLQDVPYIQAIEVDPHIPDIVVVAANSLGFGILWQPLPNSAFTDNRGIFRTEDGGKNWKKVYASDTNIGVVDMCSDPDNHSTLFAAVYTPASGKGKDAVPATSDIIKSTDGGVSWAPLASKGLPDKGRVRLGISVAAKTGGQRLYAVIEQGFYRSDDGGANWYQSSKDTRVIGSAYFSRIFSDPQNADVLYVAQTSMYRSTDGGKTFEAFAGAPSGDDYHLLWIDPQNPARLFAGVDQGAIVSVDAGKTWTTWYNQPTGQFYHVSTDNLFPYRVYGSQQDSGTAGVLSRSGYGQIQIQDWYSVGGFEYAFIAPDPAHANYVYSNGWYGSVVRYDTTTGEVAIVLEKGEKYRASNMPPLVFSPQDPSVLYLGMQMVLRTKDGGRSWQEISPDLTGYVEKPDAPAKEDMDAPPPSLTAFAPSPLQKDLMWAGTSNRIVQLTRDGGKNWQNVSPSGLEEPLRILYVEPSHHDAATAYLTVGGMRESTPPNVLRTHDFGRTWQKIVNGFPPDEMVRVMREDPKRKDLLYAGTDTGVFVSWDDGDHWLPFSLNLPPTPVTDLQVHDNDLVISTFGRAMWILDDVSTLRQLNSQVTSQVAYLFAPAATTRARWDNYQDTPYPAETPAGQNPPDGAILDYFLMNAGAADVALIIRDDKGSEVATFTTNAKAAELPPANVPEYWFAAPAALSKAAGVNRFAWDLRYPAPLTLPYGYYGNLLEYTEYTLADHAIVGDTPRQQPRGPLVAPGKYTVELRYAGRILRQPLTVVADPRVRATQPDLIAQRDLALSITRGMRSSYDTFMQVKAVRDAWTKVQKSLSAGDAEQMKVKIDALTKKLDAVDKGIKTAPGFGPVNRELGRLLFSVESADIRPAESVQAAVTQTCEALDRDLAQWREFNQKDLPAFNTMLAGSKAAALPIATVATDGCNK
jgi:photosystem II stability/assembly factor-like uncharacterized protein